ncbi:MAG: hypothetical protein HN929_14010 [Chloroflexi bacterium]|nr:hypothetical protein [Chloroflexota bacterium]
MSVLEDKMLYGLQKMLSEQTNITAFREVDSVKGVEYIMISSEDIETESSVAGSSTYIGQFNIDFMSPKRDDKYLRNKKSVIMEALADNTYYHTATTHYYFGGLILGKDQEPGEDDKWLFRYTYEISHTKVS